MTEALTDLRVCEFCGCRTNANQRACCHMGRDADREASTLGDALPREIQRVREEVMPVYAEIGPSGAFAILMMKQDLLKASAAIADGDVVAQIRAYEALKGYST